MKTLSIIVVATLWTASAFSQARRGRTVPATQSGAVLYRTITVADSDEVNSATFSPDGKVVAAAIGDGTIRLWNVADGKLLKTVRGHRRTMMLSFSPDGSMLATSDMGPISLWRVSDYQLLGTLPAADGKDEFLNGFAFSPNGEFLAAITNQGTTLWQVSNRTLSRTLARGEYSSANYSKGGFSVAFGSDGQLLFSDGRGIKQWRTSDGKLLRIWQPDKESHPLVLDSANQTLAAGGYGEINLLSAQDGTQICSLTAKDMFGEVESLAFSPDGRRLASSNLGGNDWRNGTTEDKSIRVWNVRDCRIIQTIPKSGYARHLAFSQDGKLLAIPGYIRGNTVGIRLFRVN